MCYCNTQTVRAWEDEYAAAREERAAAARLAMIDGDRMLGQAPAAGGAGGSGLYPLDDMGAAGRLCCRLLSQSSVAVLTRAVAVVCQAIADAICQGGLELTWSSWVLVRAHVSTFCVHIVRRR